MRTRLQPIRNILQNVPIDGVLLSKRSSPPFQHPLLAIRVSLLITMHHSPKHCVRTTFVVEEVVPSVDKKMSSVVFKSRVRSGYLVTREAMDYAARRGGYIICTAVGSRPLVNGLEWLAARQEVRGVVREMINGVCITGRDVLLRWAEQVGENLCPSKEEVSNPDSPAALGDGECHAEVRPNVQHVHVVGDAIIVVGVPVGNARKVECLHGRTRPLGTLGCTGLGDEVGIF